jgi:serine/threonine-protein kinase
MAAVDGGTDWTPFGPYRLIALLGRGGAGEVWRALETRRYRAIAVKLFPAGYAADADSRTQFLRGVRAVERLNEPHVIPIYDYGELDDRLFVAMKLVDGRNLHDLLLNGPLPAARAVSIIDQVASALQAAHDSALVHGDVKPSNILVDRNDLVYLIPDFGITRADDWLGPTETAAPPSALAYMAPERLRAGLVQASSDAYGLACVLYQALTGELPFAAHSFEQLATAHLFEPPPRPSQFGIPAAMDQVIAIGMAKDPGQRFSRIAELAAAARAVVNTEYPPNSPVQEVPVPGQESTTIVEKSLKSQHGTRYAMHKGSDVLRPYTVTELPLTGTGGVIHQLPFGDLQNPLDVTVDAAGTVYVADSGEQGGVFRLVAGATNAVRLPFGELRPSAVTVDSSGNVYASGHAAGIARWLQLAPGATRPTELPVAGLQSAADLAVNSAGVLFLIDWENNQVLVQMKGHALAQLPCPALRDLRGLTVDSEGNLYLIADLAGVRSCHNWVFKLEPRESRPTLLSFSGLNYAQRVAVDADGNIYAADNWAHRVVKLTPDGASGAQLPFPHIQGAGGVAVDADGNVYATDPGNKRVMKLAI